MTIGIYGGSFDPIHTGHAMVANFISQCNVVDEVWLMVSRRNPLKVDNTSACEEDRLRMVKMVSEECERVKVSNVELNLPVPSYTIETLRHLKKIYPDDEFKIIIGSDSLKNFSKWRESNTILKEYGVIVYPRPGYPLPAEEPENMIFLTGAPEVSISSTLIREYVKSGWNINYFVPISVSKYINQHKLYQ